MMKTVFAPVPVFLTVLSILCAAGAAQAVPLMNGGFELTTGNTPSFFLANNNGSLDGWTVQPLPGNESSIVFAPGEADNDSFGATRIGDGFRLGLWGPNNGGNTTATTLTSPSGGNFVAFDGDSNFRIQTLDQTITGLDTSKPYKLTFDWAAAQYKNLTSGSGFDGATTSSWQVTLGSQTFTTPVVGIPSHGFSGWMTQTFTFNPINSTELLRFIAIGAPDGLPPVSLLDGMTLEIVPEPGSLLIVGIGLLVSVAVGRFRAKSANV